jgi:hypothetical protein
VAASRSPKEGDLSTLEGIFMIPASIRLAFLLATLVASLHVAAAPRFWTLTGLNGGTGGSVATFATGYFSYDDATNTVSSWNIHVTDFPNVFVPRFTYVPGNSSVSVAQPSGAAAPTLLFSATIDAPTVRNEPGFGVRQLQIAPIAALDGSNATVSLDTSSSREAILSLGPTRVRSMAGSLVLTPVAPPVVIAQVDEFYNPALRHYFITANDAEKQALDTGVHPGWQRTGESFQAYAKGSSTGDSIVPVCRYYSPPSYEDDFGVVVPFGVDSHFFTADAAECVTVFRLYDNFLWGFGRRQRVPDCPARQGDRRLSCWNHSGVPLVEPAGGFQSPLHDEGGHQGGHACRRLSCRGLR